MHTQAFTEILIQLELLRYFDNLNNEVKDIRDREEVLDVIPKLEELLIEPVDR